MADSIKLNAELKVVSFHLISCWSIIFQVKEKFKLASMGKESFTARIYPGIDYAFIVSLLVMLNDIESN